MEDWNNTPKLYGLACFYHAKPSNPDGDGDSCEFFDKRHEAEARADRLLAGGRFKYIVLWHTEGTRLAEFVA